MFWDNFYNACLAKNIKPSAVVQKLGLSGGSVTTWKKRPPNAETLLVLADALDVSVDYLLGRKEPKNEPVDPMTQILIKHFNKLSAQDKIDFLNMIIEKAS